jgi:predicted RNA-binding Zn-ribbon protein involved in translation (DUF1610 family)
MSAKMNCPGCRTPLRLRDDMAGSTIKCPRCARSIAIPAEGVHIEEERTVPAPLAAVSPAARSSEPDASTRSCPECGERLAVTAKRCSSCNTPLYKPCPRCGEEGAKRVKWTPWGSFYGPALFAHVRCPVCGYAYNGKSGRSNFIPAIIFVTVPLLLILVILCVLGWIIYHRSYM